jgi:hypothetical protein
VSWIDGKPVYLLLDPDPAPPAPQPHTIHDNRGNAYHLLPPLPGGLQPFTVTNAKPNPEPHAGSSGEHCPPRHRNPLRATTPGGGDTDPNALRRPFARNTYDTLETIGWAGYAVSFGAIRAQIWSWQFLADPKGAVLELRDSLGASIYGAYQLATDPPAYLKSQTNQTMGILIAGTFVTVAATVWRYTPNAWCETSNTVAAAPSAKFTHDQFVQIVRPGARERVFHPNAKNSKGLGSRRYDDFDDVTGTAFEGNTTPWNQMTPEKLQEKLHQVGSDVMLLNYPKSGVNKVIWFGTEELPTTGLGGQLRDALQQAGIPYWVVVP